MLACRLFFLAVRQSALRAWNKNALFSRLGSERPRRNSRSPHTTYIEKHGASSSAVWVQAQLRRREKLSESGGRRAESAERAWFIMQASTHVCGIETIVDSKALDDALLRLQNTLNNRRHEFWKIYEFIWALKWLKTIHVIQTSYRSKLG